MFSSSIRRYPYYRVVWLCGKIGENYFFKGLLICVSRYTIYMIYKYLTGVAFSIYMNTAQCFVHLLCMCRALSTSKAWITQHVYIQKYIVSNIGLLWPKYGTTFGAVSQFDHTASCILRRQILSNLVKCWKCF